MSGFAIFLLLFPLIGVLVLSTPMVAKFDWDIPVYKKIFIATAFLIAASFTVRTFLIFDNEDYDNKLILVYIDNFLTLSVIPFLYWFVKSITVEHQKFSCKNYLHFLPALILGTAVIILGESLRENHSAYELLSQQLQLQKSSMEWWFYFCNTKLMDIVLIVQISYTAAVAIIHIDRFRRDAKKYYSELCESGYMHFLRILILVVLFVLLYSTKILAKKYMNYAPEIAVTFSVCCTVVVYMLFWSVNKIEFYADKITLTKESLSMNHDDQTQEGSELEMTAELENIKNALDRWSNDPSKPYLKQGISLEDLSKEIGFSGKDVSTYLNKVENQTFFIFIAKLRAKEAKELLLSSENYSLTYIALECGFSDAPNFSRSFKNIEGMTPGAWRLLHQK